MAAAGALEYPKTNSRNDNKENLYFTLLYKLNGQAKLYKLSARVETSYQDTVDSEVCKGLIVPFVHVSPALSSHTAQKSQ